MKLIKKTSNSSESEETSRQQLDCLIELAVMLGQQNNFQETLRLVSQKAASLLGADISLIMMINPKTHQTVKTLFASGEDHHQKDYHFIHSNICGWVIKNNRSFISTNLPGDSRFQKRLFSKLPVESAVCVPLRTEGIIIGTLLLLNKHSGKSFQEADLEYLERFAAIASPFLRNIHKIQHYFQAPIPEKTLLHKYRGFGLLGKSKKFIELLHAMEAASRADVRILLEGESGTGKELIARAIHNLSSRTENKFIAIDCGAIPANLIESELFGHVKGAFTGATSERRGLMEEANGGTMFMDEISNLPSELQAKLLRVLQEGEIRPLGSNKNRRINVRIISACSTPLGKLVQDHYFREDLFYRLHVYPIKVPSLDERREDIPLLANHFLNKFAAEQGKNTENFHEELIEYMRQRHWPGNIRELENFVERLVTLTAPDSNMIDIDLLPVEFRKDWLKRKEAAGFKSAKRPLEESLRELEETLIYQALNENNWNRSKAARQLKISEQTIRYKIKKLGLSKPPEQGH